MSREEFLRGLEEALAGEVPASVVRDNLNYYSSYLSQELAKGRTMEEIIEEIGEPRIVARTIIDSTDAAAEAGDYGAYEDRSSRDGYGNSGYDSYDSYDSGRNGYDGGRGGYGSGYDGGSRKDGGYGSYEEDPRKRWFQSHNIHYIDLNKWYWKLLFGATAILLIVLVFSIVSGIFALLIQFAGPILLILFLYWFIKSLRR